MTGIRITDEMVEVGARALFQCRAGELLDWEAMSLPFKDAYRRRARLVLEAVARLMLDARDTETAGVLDDLAIEMEAAQRKMREEDDRTIRSSGLGEGVRMVRARAASLRGER